MAKRDSNSINKGRTRYRTLVVFVSMFVAILFGRLFVLQVMRHDEYARFAQNNQLQRERVPSPRGYFRDRAGRILVDNVLHFEVNMSWRRRADVEGAATRLAMYLPVDTTKVMKLYRLSGVVSLTTIMSATVMIVTYLIATRMWEFAGY